MSFSAEPKSDFRYNSDFSEEMTMLFICIFSHPYKLIYPQVLIFSFSVLSFCSNQQKPLYILHEFENSFDYYAFFDWVVIMKGEKETILFPLKYSGRR